MFAILMGLFYFSFVMIMGHMSFVRPEWLARLGAWWKRQMGDMEMIYDGRCGFCVRSMAWFLAFDGLGQIKVRDFRTRPSAVVSDAQLEKALYAVLPDGRALPGFEAYRYVVLRVPGLWWHGAVLLCAGAQPPRRRTALRLDRRQPRPAVGRPGRPRRQVTAASSVRFPCRA